jgi:hypothetical protein
MPRRWRWLLVLASLSLTHCTPVLEGEYVDLEQVLKVDQPPAPPVPVVPRPSPDHSQPRVWIPRVVAPNGDVIGGHALDLSPIAPAPESVEPRQVIPRPPRHVPAQTTTPKVRMVPAGSLLPLGREGAPRLPEGLPPPEAMPHPGVPQPGGRYEQPFP